MERAEWHLGSETGHCLHHVCTVSLEVSVEPTCPKTIDCFEIIILILVSDNLYLYSTPDLPQQQVYVDRSGMGTLPLTSKAPPYIKSRKICANSFLTQAKARLASATRPTASPATASTPAGRLRTATSRLTARRPSSPAPAPRRAPPRPSGSTPMVTAPRLARRTARASASLPASKRTPPLARTATLKQLRRLLANAEGCVSILCMNRKVL